MTQFYRNLFTRLYTVYVSKKEVHQINFSISTYLKDNVVLYTSNALDCLLVLVNYVKKENCW